MPTLAQKDGGLLSTRRIVVRNTERNAPWRQLMYPAGQFLQRDTDRARRMTGQERRLGANVQK